MRLLGLDATSLALAVLASGALLLWLYRQRQPARRVVVPALTLWSKLLPTGHEPVVVWSRARVWRSLLLALAIVLALLSALGNPELTRAPEGQDLVLLVDCSASMSAHDGAPTRLDAAKARARQRLRALGPHDHAWVLSLSTPPAPLTPRSTDLTVLLSAVDGLTTCEPGATFADGVRLARELLRPYPHGELLLLSDGALEQGEALVDLRGDMLMHHERFGTSARNVAITQLAARPLWLDPSHHELLVSLENFGAEDEPLLLQVLAGTLLLYEERLTLQAGTALTRVLPTLPASDAVLRAQLVLTRGPDLLSRDDRVEAQPPRRGVTRVLSVSKDNRYLEAALLLDDSYRVSEIAPADYRDTTGFDLVIFDGVLPAQAPTIPALYLGPIQQEGAFPLARAESLERPHFDLINKAHPLVRGLALSDVNVARATRLFLTPGDLALAETATHAPLIALGKRDEQPFVALSFDLRESDLPLRAAFPLLFLRTLDALRNPSLTPITSASQLLRTESQIAPRQLELSPSQPQPATATSSRSWPWLAFAALFLLTLEWLSFHRRWTV